MASSSNTVVGIYFNDGGVPRLVGRLPKVRAVLMCVNIQPQLDRGGLAKSAVKESTGVIFNAPDVDMASLQALLAFMRKYDTHGDFANQEPSCKSVGLGSFYAGVMFFCTCHAVGLKHKIRGNKLRDQLLHHIEAGPDTFQEFKLVYEGLYNYDYGMFVSMLKAMLRLKHTMPSPPADMAKIETFMHEQHLDRKMKTFEREICAQLKEEAKQANVDTSQPEPAIQAGPPPPAVSWAVMTRGGSS